MPDLVHIDLDAVRAFARSAHAGQMRRHGAPYITHPYAVADFVDDIADAAGIPIDDEVRAAALLHDVIEDSPATEQELATRFSPRVGRWVRLLSKGPDAHSDAEVAAYFAAIDAEDDDGLRLIKICDRCHNLSELTLARDDARAKRYVEETLRYLVPLAQHARSGALVQALSFALHTAAANHGFVVSEALQGEILVPQGLYALVSSGDETRLRAILEGGAAMVQLRIKGAASADVTAAAKRLLPLCRAYKVPLLINDDVDVAAEADGVHLGQADETPRDARARLPASSIVGLSTHDDAQFDAVLTGGAGAGGGVDYIAVGPVFPSSTKAGHAAVVGVGALQQRCARTSLPVVAIGGIGDAARAAAVGRAGAHAFAVVAALDVMDPRPVAFRLGLSFFAARRPAR